MKPLILIIVFSLGIGCLGKAQNLEELYFNNSGRQVWITKTAGEKVPRALLFKVSEDSLFYVETKVKTLNAQNVGLEVKRIHYSEIGTLVTVKNKPVGKGALIGGLIGFVGGILVHAATFETSSDSVSQLFLDAAGGESAFLFGAGILGGAVGAAAGAGVGAVAKKKWIIKGLESNFKEALPELDKRAYWNKASSPISTTGTN